MCQKKKQMMKGAKNNKMKIDIKALHFDLDGGTRDYAADKIGRLEKYYKNVILAEVTLVCDHEDHAGSTYIAKVKLQIPGKDLFAESGSRNINEAIDLVEDRLKQQILKLRDRSTPKKLHQIKQRVRDFFGK